MVLLWIGFFICSAVVVFSGINLSRYGDVIAEKSGLGRAWIGLILMASITSLPEMITGISSVALVDAPDIAFGDVFGSCIYNLAILAVMDLLNGKRPLFFGADKGHILGAGFGIMLISIAVVSIIISPTGLHIAHIGFYTPLIIVIYIFGVRAIYYYEQDAIKEFVYETAVRRLYDHLTLKRAVVLYAVNASVILVAATILPFIADRLAEVSGLGRTFMGSVFVAMTTSLPELVVSITAVRIGAQDMAIANLLGSNLFNILVLAFDDIVYTTGPIFGYVSQTHITTGILAVVMSAVVVIGLTYPPKVKRVGTLCWYSVVLIFIWILNMVLLYGKN